jgi:hypothetical protein
MWSDHADGVFQSPPTVDVQEFVILSACYQRERHIRKIPVIKQISIDLSNIFEAAREVAARHRPPLQQRPSGRRFERLFRQQPGFLGSG